MKLHWKLHICPAFMGCCQQQNTLRYVPHIPAKPASPFLLLAACGQGLGAAHTTQPSHKTILPVGSNQEWNVTHSYSCHIHTSPGCSSSLCCLQDLSEDHSFPSTTACSMDPFPSPHPWWVMVPRMWSHTNCAIAVPILWPPREHAFLSLLCLGLTKLSCCTVAELIKLLPSSLITHRLKYTICLPAPWGVIAIIYTIHWYIKATVYLSNTSNRFQD